MQCPRRVQTQQGMSSQCSKLLPGPQHHRQHHRNGADKLKGCTAYQRTQHFWSMATHSDLSILAERMVISFVTSSAGPGVEAEAAARSMGASSLRLGLLAESADSQLLILSEDSKRFYRPQSTLAGAAASARSIMWSDRTQSR